MDSAACQRCGAWFERDAAWKVICRHCWEATHERATCAKCGEPFYRDAAWKRVCFRCYRGNNSSGYQRRDPPPREPPPSEDGGVIPPHVLRALIQLCHPDKHGGSDTANRVTQWLLQQRRK